MPVTKEYVGRRENRGAGSKQACRNDGCSKQGEHEQERRPEHEAEQRDWGKNDDGCDPREELRELVAKGGTLGRLRWSDRLGGVHAATLAAERARSRLGKS